MAVRYVFEPPFQGEMPRTTIDMSRADARFWSYFRRNPVGQNVYKLVTGEYTVVQPEPVLLAHIYFGGHIEEVDADEAARLEAAGFSVTVAGGEPIDDLIDEWSDLAGRTWVSLAGNDWSDL